MLVTKKNLIMAMMIAIGLCTSMKISAMESREQRAEEMRLDRLRRQQMDQPWNRQQYPSPSLGLDQPHQQNQQQEPLQLNRQQQKLKQKALVNNLEALQSLQQTRQQKSLSQQQFQQLQKLEQQFQQLPPQQFQQLEQKLQRRNINKQQKKQKKQRKQQQLNQQQQSQSRYNNNNNNSNNSNSLLNQQQPPKLQQQSQLPQNTLATKEIAMKQILLDERDRDIRRLEELLTSPLHQSLQLQEEVERLQIPIDLYLMEPSEELENKAQQIQSQSNQPTAKQQTQQDQMQQQRLEQVQQEEILKQIQSKQPSLQQLETQESEENICCIGAMGCTESKGMRPIPCKNKHNDLLCDECLRQIKDKNDRCPMCLEPLTD